MQFIDLLLKQPCLRRKLLTRSGRLFGGRRVGRNNAGYLIHSASACSTAAAEISATSFALS